MIAASGRGTITMFETATGEKLGEIRRSDVAVRCAFFPGGKTLFVADFATGQHSLAQVDIKSGEVILAFAGVSTGGNVLAVSSAGTPARIVGTALEVFDPATGKAQWSAELSAWSLALEFSPNGQLLATGGRDAVVRVWDVSTGKLLHTLNGHDGEVTSLTFSRDGRWLLSGGGNVALVWDLEALAAKKELP